MPGVAKPQKKFLVTLFVTILLMRGKVNFRNLSRYSDLSEKTYARQFRQSFDFADFNERLMAEIVPPQHEKIGAMDCSYLTKSGRKTYGLGFFYDEAFPQEIKDYIRSGEQGNIQRGYKCRIRKRWYDVPSIYIPNAFLFRQIHRYPLLVVNEAKAASTDTIHRVRVKNGLDIQLLATIFFNSLTLAWAEVCGRSYGGGVLELEPREAEELPIFYKDNIEIDIEKVEDLLRQDRAYAALDYVDNIILKNYLGFDNFMINKIRSAWEQLRDRRVDRK